MKIRPEEHNDIDAIEKITRAAFLNHPYSHQTEHLIVNGLREAGALAVSLVAEADDEVVGHIAFSAVEIEGSHSSWFGLGPISVHPDFQRRGIGQALMQAGLAAIRALGAGGCVLVGEPEFYGRFGFTQADTMVLEGVPPKNLLALAFDDRIPGGAVSFHPAFFIEG
jgi:putative acetyltransferase